MLLSAWAVWYLLLIVEYVTCSDALFYSLVAARCIPHDVSKLQERGLVQSDWNMADDWKKISAEEFHQLQEYTSCKSKVSVRDNHILAIIDQKHMNIFWTVL